MTRGKQGAGTTGRDPRELAKDWAGDPGLSGSPRGEFTLALLNQACAAVWSGPDPDPRLVEVQQDAALQAMQGIAPRDPVEGMLAAQLLATHDAAMQCYRRASAAEQTFEGRDMALRHAAKLARAYAALVEALDRHRGKGQPQVVRVERVTVEAGGRAIVGAVSHQRGGGDQESVGQSHAKRLGHAPEPALRGADADAGRGGNPCRSPAVKGKRRCRMHGANAGAPAGNRNALKHGLRTTEAAAFRKAVRALLRTTREVIEET